MSNSYKIYVSQDEATEIATETVQTLLVETGLISPEDIDAICGATSEVTT